MSDSPKRPLDAMPAETPELLQREFRVDRRTRPSPVPELDPSRVPTDPDRQEAPAREPEFSPTALTPPLPGRAQPPSPTQWAQRPGPAAPPNLPRRAPPVATGGLPPAATAPPPGAAAPPARSQPPQGAPAAQPRPARSAPRPASRPVRQELPQHLMVTLPGAPAAPRVPPQAYPPPLEVAPPPPARVAPAPPPAVTAPTPGPAPSASAPAASSAVRASPAGLGRRLAAWLVDLGLISLLCGLFLAVAMLVIAPRGVSVARSLAAVALPGALLLLVLAFVYAALFAFLFQGRTPGRGLTGIRLVDERGGAPGPAKALARAALALVSVVLFLAGFWLALFDRRGQTLHDKLTKTFVVRLLDA